MEMLPSCWGYFILANCLLINIFVYIMYFQVCEQCQNVKFEREGYFVTVDIEKGMQDGQVSLIYWIWIPLEVLIQNFLMYE